MNSNKGFQFTVHTAWNDKFDGTHLQGRMYATRRELTEVFGEPFDYTDGSVDSDGKVTTEWLIEFEDGVLTTIYDWKRYESGPPALDENYAWHIGGHRMSEARIAALLPPF